MKVRESRKPFGNEYLKNSFGWSNTSRTVMQLPGGPVLACISAARSSRHMAGQSCVAQVTTVLELALSWSFLLRALWNNELKSSRPSKIRHSANRGQAFCRDGAAFVTQS